MKNVKLQLMLTGFILCSVVIPAFAQEKSKEEKKLETIAGELDKKYSEGQQRVADMIKSQFGVNDGLIMGLRYKNMRDSEIAIALGLAQEMHRGITDTNLHMIVTLRQGPPVSGWGKIAKKLDLKLGPVISKAQNICAAVREDEKGHKARESKKMEDEKIKKQEKLEKSEKNGKDEKTGEPKKSWMDRMKDFMRS